MVVEISLAALVLFGAALFLIGAATILAIIARAVAREKRLDLA